MGLIAVKLRAEIRANAQAMCFFRQRRIEKNAEQRAFHTGVIKRFQNPYRSAFAAQYGAEAAANSLRALVATTTLAKGFGTANRSRFSNTVVDRLPGDALQTMDDERRDESLGRAIRFAINDQPLIPALQGLKQSPW